MFDRTVVGLEITKSALRAVELRLSRTPVVMAVSEILIPESDQKHAGGLDVMAMSPLVQDLFAKATPHPIKSREAYLSVTEEKVFRKILELPGTVSDSELDMVVNNEISSYLPSEAETMQIDYQVAAPKGGKDPHHQVAVVAVEKSIIQDYMALANSSKLHVRAIDTSPAALARTFIGPKDKSDAILVQWDGVNAVIVLIQDGLVWTTGSTRAGEDVEAAASSIADELDHATKFFMNRVGRSERIKKVSLVSGHPKVGEMQKALQAQLDEEMDVSMAKPIVGLSASGMAYATALGSALYPAFEHA